MVATPLRFPANQSVGDNVLARPNVLARQAEESVDRDGDGRSLWCLLLSG